MFCQNTPSTRSMFNMPNGGGGELLGLDLMMSYLVPRRGRNGKSGTT